MPDLSSDKNMDCDTLKPLSKLSSTFKSALLVGVFDLSLVFFESFDESADERLTSLSVAKIMLFSVLNQVSEFK